MQPAPAAASTLNFQYYGAHTIDSVPIADTEAVMAYARYVALSARAAWMGAEVNFSEDDVEEYPATNAVALTALAKQALEDFDRMIRKMCYATLG